MIIYQDFAVYECILVLNKIVIIIIIIIIIIVIIISKNTFDTPCLPCDITDCCIAQTSSA